MDDFNVGHKREAKTELNYTFRMKLKNLSQVRLTTKRLRLVPVSMKYASGIFKEFTDEITFYMHPKSPSPSEAL